MRAIRAQVKGELYLTIDDTASEVRNLPLEKLYNIIKLLSKFLCKLRSKYLSMNNLVVLLKSKLENAYPRNASEMILRN